MATSEHIDAVADPALAADVENLAPTVKAAIDGLRDSGVLPEDDTRWVTEVRLRAGDPERAASLSLLITPAVPMTHPTERTTR